MSPSPSRAERLPQQERSRRTWDRVLEAGTELVAEEGWSGLTITGVCRRAGVTAPSIYARVDGKAGLFLAVHERQLAQMRVTEDELIARYVRDGAPAEQAAAAAATVIAGVFEIHGKMLRSLIDRSAHDSQMLDRGSAASRALLSRLAEHIPLDEGRTWMLLRAVYAACVMRTMYGASLLQPAGSGGPSLEEEAVSLARTIASAGAVPG
ncbi:TetR/AcrR family transcriptional regulator [Arthrobacter sp. Sa2CUA1]|uniref:TetR/AcrR family transcriptional regulator n=1 Tax=Arthrobacter gallicola TaxID=2762225 RepID=A0ABR8UQV2_9MICC|nr:TetR/AcrR family transcriptional regulator [Arthrobacter gallicola]MBD7994939.1 TetR/AcrR family transcriptional regulator [Arthrobacter gallicola]